MKKTAMIEIVNDGLIESGDQLMALAGQSGQIVLPRKNSDLDLTHWRGIRADGAEMLYFGMPETFTMYIAENNGRVQ